MCICVCTCMDVFTGLTVVSLVIQKHLTETQKITIDLSTVGMKLTSIG